MAAAAAAVGNSAFIIIIVGYQVKRGGNYISQSGSEKGRSSVIHILIAALLNQDWLTIFYNINKL